MSGHEFQNQKPRGVGQVRIGRTSPATGGRAVSVYRGGSPLPVPHLDPLADAELQGLRRQSEFQQIIFNFTTDPQLALSRSARSYFMVQNLDAAANLFIGFGTQPTGTVGVRLSPFASYEPFQVPQNDVFLIGDAAGTAVILYANE